jgi:hypothetical protein
MVPHRGAGDRAGAAAADARGRKEEEEEGLGAGAGATVVVLFAAAWPSDDGAGCIVASMVMTTTFDL